MTNLLFKKVGGMKMAEIGVFSKITLLRKIVNGEKVSYQAKSVTGDEWPSTV